MISIFDEKETKFAPRQGRRIFQSKLMPFVKENLKTRDTVVISEKDVRELFNISEKRAKFLSLYSKMLYLAKLTDNNIKVSRGTHNDGSNVIAFYYDDIRKEKTEDDKQ